VVPFFSIGSARAAPRPTDMSIVERTAVLTGVIFADGALTMAFIGFLLLHLR
jgi:hypothetical protein